MLSVRYNKKYLLVITLRKFYLISAQFNCRRVVDGDVTVTVRQLRLDEVLQSTVRQNTNDCGDKRNWYGYLANFQF